MLPIVQSVSCQHHTLLLPGEGALAPSPQVLQSGFISYQFTATPDYFHIIPTLFHVHC